MFPCPTSDCSYSVENKTEIRQVKIPHIITWYSSFNIEMQISSATATLRWNGANGEQTIWSGADGTGENSWVRVKSSLQVQLELLWAELDSLIILQKAS